MDMKTNVIKNLFAFDGSIIRYSMIVLLCLFVPACSSDESEESEDEMVSNYRFVLKGNGIDDIMEGTGIFFNQTVTDGVTFEGDDTKLTTVLIIAQKGSTGEEVAFAITREGTDIKTGSYPIGSDVGNFYNAFMNYSEDRKEDPKNALNTITYQSYGGSLKINSKSSGFVSGSVNVDLESLEDGGTLNIKGTFTAPSVN